MIGVFDSGIGGLTVLKEINKQLPEVNAIYIADSAFTPYGNKTSEQIIERCFFLVEKLISQGAEIIVVACNTATAIAINDLRESFDVPIVAMEPAVKPAVETSKQGKVGILATEMTLSSKRYISLLERFAIQTKVIEQACPGLVEQIEALNIESVETEKLIQKYIEPMLQESVDAIVLGCTHYPFIRDQILKKVNEEITIIDTAYAVVKELKNKLPKNKRSKNQLLQYQFYTTGSVIHFQKQLDVYWLDQVRGKSLL